jgi:glucokinase
MVEGVALAVDVGGTRIRAALVDTQGRVMHRQSLATPAQEGADAVVAAIATAARAVMAAGGRPEGLKLGLCAPGPLDARRGLALATPTIRGFTNFPLRDKVSEALGLPVTIENDGPCAALGEWMCGAGRGAADFVYVTISTGIGGGIVSEGRLLRGRLGLAGHIGHIPIRPEGGATCFCGQPGCWEAEASGSALTKKAVAAGFSGLADAFAAAEAGETGAMAFAASAAADIALGLAAVIHVLNPERIVIGGGVANALPLLGPMIRHNVDARILPPFRGVDILPAALGDDSGLAGAAQLVLRPACALAAGEGQA